MESLHWDELVPFDLILLSQGSSARAQFDRAVANSPTPVGLRYDVTHMATAVQLVRQGLGVALLPRLALPALYLQDLPCRPIDDDTAQRTIGILQRRDRHPSPAAQAFWKELEKVARHVEKTLPPLGRRLPKS